MTTKRHDDTPARGRRRYERAAGLALLALGSNLGCGREVIRGPIMADGPSALPLMVASPTRPVAEYGSNLAELFPVTYRDGRSYGPHLVGTVAPRPLEEPARESSYLLAASPDPAVKPASWTPDGVDARKELEAQRAAFKATRRTPPQPLGGSLWDVARIAPRNLPELRPTPSAEPADLMTACQSTRIPPPQAPSRLGSGSTDLLVASQETGIAPPISPVSRGVDLGRSLEAACREANIPPPRASTAGAEAPVDLLTACTTTRIAPPRPPGPAGDDPLRTASQASNIPMPIPAASQASNIPMPIPAPARRHAAPAEAPVPIPPPSTADVAGISPADALMPLAQVPQVEAPPALVPGSDAEPPLPELSPDTFPELLLGPGAGAESPAQGPDAADLAAASEATRIPPPAPPPAR